MIMGEIAFKATMVNREKIPFLWYTFRLEYNSVKNRQDDFFSMKIKASRGKISPWKVESEIKIQKHQVIDFKGDYGRSRENHFGGSGKQGLSFIR